jgi:hypothetical protein
MDLDEGLVELARVPPAATPVVSVYLDTEWTDEQQRERVRIFLKNELREARRADGAARAADVDLDWIEEQGGALLQPDAAEEARGVALFACEAVGLRKLLRSRVAFESLFAVDAAPRLRPLAEARDAAPSALLVFVDTETAASSPSRRPASARNWTSRPRCPDTTSRAGAPPSVCNGTFTKSERVTTSASPSS